MRRWCTVIAASAILGAGPGFMASPAVAVPASAKPATWHLVYRGPAHSWIGGIAAPARNDAWAFGSTAGGRNFYLHWDGHSWKPAHIPGTAGFGPEAILASSPANVWLFGQAKAGDDEALVYDGHSWRPVPAPSTGALPRYYVVASSTDVWMAVQTSGPSAQQITSTEVANWNGHGWQTYTVPGDLEFAGGGAHPWLVGVMPAGKPHHLVEHEVVYRWSGSAWQRFPAPGRTAAYFLTTASPGGRLWLATESSASAPWRLYEWHTGAWSRLRAPSSLYAGPRFDPPVFDGRDGFWSLPYHWTGRRWIDTAPGHPLWLSTLTLVAPVPGTSSVWAGANLIPFASTTVGRAAIACYGPTP